MKKLNNEKELVKKAIALGVAYGEKRGIDKDKEIMNWALFVSSWLKNDPEDTIRDLNGDNASNVMIMDH